MEKINILEKPISIIKNEVPQLISFLSEQGINLNGSSQPLGEFLEKLGDEFYEDIGIDEQMLIQNINGFLEELRSEKQTEKPRVDSITIFGGHDKNKIAENIELTLYPGTVSSIVGPTGSGKSRLLADIEWMRRLILQPGAPFLLMAKNRIRTFVFRWNTSWLHNFRKI